MTNKEIANEIINKLLESDVEAFERTITDAEKTVLYVLQQVESVVLADVSNCSCINRDTLTPEARKMFDDIDKALERKK